LNQKHRFDRGLFPIQVATGPSVATYGRKALEALLAGFSFHYAKPMLVAEVRRIMPSNTGLPIELSFYTAAVAAATVECKLQKRNLTQGKYSIANLTSFFTDNVL
jgi:hypothetical protein